MCTELDTVIGLPGFIGGEGSFCLIDFYLFRAVG
jgi:hypothetical protein